MEERSLFQAGHDLPSEPGIRPLSGSDVTNVTNIVTATIRIAVTIITSTMPENIQKKKHADDGRFGPRIHDVQVLAQTSAVLAPDIESL